MNVLHIANYYIGAKVYKNLVECLDQSGVEQTIFTAFSGQHLVGANNPKLTVQDSKIIYRPILNTLTRLNYLHKVKKITTDILSNVSPKKFNCIHAIPYSVTEGSPIIYRNSLTYLIS